MLSILIPTYNYNISALVNEVYCQIKKLDVSFEILCYDDGSTDINIINANKEINKLENTKYVLLEKNIGRSAIRNRLAKDAKSEWLLFLDADVLPKDNNFISTYFKSITKTSQVIYGGILYDENKPGNNHLLRWVYGRQREALPTAERKKNIYLSFLTLNFLIKKEVFNLVTFDEKIPNLRHEDTLFSYHLKLKKIKVEHIKNPTYHLGLEKSSMFLKKSIESVDALHLFLEQNLIPKNYTLITRVFFKLKGLKLHYLFAFIYKNFKSSFEKNLLSKKPSLYIFDLYRLSYLCFLYT
ncbi:glycosyltransferase family 2 protein [Lacinutrix sp. C3R15]|uniref:glycosyltransferase family 2 protein n=1 Tax=Flavobacteriaceae TaxID=49546 RepID=UPI001C092629|nr:MULTISPECIES: glycosyltransferase family 2 protein [Flavobacteriaceae]MBU2939653.1 glycosyltransferase family 2 protein [Lacinutrix sp. C3R15]MDO6622968.1 glycosyltransferase family 2 protein [Oceanihabitans sp. 1_MG-2023]